jgi:hypothetical protein
VKRGRFPAFAGTSRVGPAWLIQTGLRYERHTAAHPSCQGLTLASRDANPVLSGLAGILCGPILGSSPRKTIRLCHGRESTSTRTGIRRRAWLDMTWVELSVCRSFWTIFSRGYSGRFAFSWRTFSGPLSLCTSQIKPCDANSGVRLVKVAHSDGPNRAEAGARLYPGGTEGQRTRVAGRGRAMP